MPYLPCSAGLLRLAALVVLAVLLVACANLSTTPPASPEPAAASPTPTIEPTPTPVPLTATLRSSQGGYSLRYPQGWQTREFSNTLALAANDAAIEATNPGADLVILVDSTPLNAYTPEEAADIEGLFRYISTFPQDSNYTLGATEPVTVAGETGLATDLLAGGEAGRLIVLRRPPQAIWILGQAAPDAWTDHRPLFDAIVESLRFFTPEPPPDVVPESPAEQPTLITASDETPAAFALRLGSDEGPASSRFALARGLAAAPDGTVYLAERGRGVWVFAADGTLQANFGAADLNDAYDVALGIEGDLFVADAGRHAIVRFQPDGTLVERWGEAGDGPDQFGLQAPQRLAIGPDRSVYALDSRTADGATRSSILRFNGEDGSFIERIELPPEVVPEDIAIDQVGTIYVAEIGNRAVTKVDGQGQIAGRLGQSVDPEGIRASALDLGSDGTVYVASERGMLKLGANGALLASVGTVIESGGLPQPGEFISPNSLAVVPGEGSNADAGAVVWVSDNSGEYSAITALRFPAPPPPEPPEPTEPAAAEPAEGAPTDELTSTATITDAEPLRQWASAATASSAYSEDYGADSMTGPPDVVGCTTNPNAWASAVPGTEETVELTFDEPVFADQVVIHQSHRPGFITAVELLDTGGTATTVYTGTAQLQADCPALLAITFERTLERISGVNLTIDQRPGSEWLEIDAVELVGIP